MSIKIMVAIWETGGKEPNGSELLLLLALADMANDDAICWPGMGHLAKKCRTSRHHVIKLLKSLVGRGLVTKQVSASKWHTNIYTIHPELVNAGALVHASAPSLVHASAPSLVHQGAHKSSGNHQVTVSATKQRSRAPRQTDPRSSHPAIQAFREVAGHYPHKELYDQVIVALGETPDMDRARACWVAWLKVSNNRFSAVWALEWYPNGGPPQRSQNATQTPEKARRPTQVVR